MNAFKEGLAAFKSGDIGNPYPPNTRLNRDFEYGFNKAYFSNQRRQIEYERKINKEGSKGKQS